MSTATKSPPAKAAEGIAARLDAVVSRFAQRGAVLPLDAELLEALRVAREEVASFASEAIRREERHAEEIVALRARIKATSTSAGRACRDVAELAEERERVMRGRDEMLARAYRDGEAAADERYRNAAAGSAPLEAFVEANRLRTGEDLAKRWRERKGA